MENVLCLYDQPAQVNRARLCFDERPCQLLNDVVAALPVKPGKAAKEDNEYIREGTAVVLLAYDLDKGFVTHRCENGEQKLITLNSCRE